MKVTKSTALGCAAILLWSSVVALLRNVSEQFGPIGGAAWVYSLSSLFLLRFIGIPDLKKIPKLYLIAGGILFVGYETCMALSLGFANNRIQAIEMGVINYMWPALTILLALISTRRKVHWFLFPGLCLSLGGVAWVVTDGSILSVDQLGANIGSNPISYSLAFSGAIFWALYCNVTRQWAQKSNLITVFFIATSAVLWLEYALSSENGFTFNPNALISLFLASAVISGGYAFWNIGILGGNMLLLATLSYFTPIFSTCIAAILLKTTLTPPFWQGVLMVTVGSLISWRSIEKAPPPDDPTPTH